MAQIIYDKSIIEMLSLFLLRSEDLYAYEIMKKIKDGTLDNEKRELFVSLLATRSNEHTGGRRMKK